MPPKTIDFVKMSGAGNDFLLPISAPRGVLC